MTGRVGGALLRYLAVAHFGRGRGDFVAGEYPPHWGPLVEAAVASRRTVLDGLWSSAATGGHTLSLQSSLRALLEAMATEVLAALYPRRA
jgi:hypothetical protein